LIQINAKAPDDVNLKLLKQNLLPLIFVVVIGCFLLVVGAGAHAQSLHDAHERANVPCAACHMPEPSDIAPQEKSCVACHGTMLEPREGKQEIWPDPHRSPHLGAGEVPVCSECHKIHTKSEVTCVMCHRNFKFEPK
jgi:hypothetical protein